MNDRLGRGWLEFVQISALCLFLFGCSSQPVATVLPTPALTQNLPAITAAASPAAKATLTLAFPSTPTAESVQASGRPSATPSCSNGLLFVADLTVPDGTIIARGAEVDKRWEVKNSGTCNWDQDYRLKLISGIEMGLPIEQALYPARGGSNLVIRMLLKTPGEPGVYRSAWQAIDPQGEVFGDIIYVDIQVN